ncbi:MAG: type II toxin-antitoxin system VapC family toxin [Serratia marcescens]|jgi:PIN domain nuclease of toxin-antitoxin system|uniref:type II toxin-antitoxin system VapC family toxin n=1 Tax=Serratia TaxID=613 RepID=UPI0002F4BDF5|nr:type II toxin-antitoxin system VapC family toxin [Serratia marcescens]MBH3137220.1 type II toxin-antitoxin system VapC family toxin [Serratia marcescens]MCC7688028.1 type II toxin-antitoxin system VapC family toxin [Serratia marcescens]MDK1706800.1 type II toxin-antitoxin system VapC family toxin [Serratia marcescens]MDP0520213.1 type II toxin-antitoxin system VapC family toxin [Serratia marcescens]MDP8668766.1 type II toxin-antitoxin system VapC family toxin [Serratia marcescens]
MKRLLLDTHALLWWLIDDACLGANAKRQIADPGNAVYVSAASIWEISIKQAQGKLALPEDIFAIIEAEDFLSLPMDAFHCQQAGQLPPYHQDPFDRMLIAQAQAEGLTLISADAVFPQYGVRVADARR